HFIKVFFRQQVWCAVAVEFAPFSREVQGDLWVIVGHDPTGWDVHDCRNRDATWVVRETFEVVFLDSCRTKDRIDTARIKVKGPGIGIMGWARGAQRDGIFESKQTSHDDGAVRPWTSPCSDQTVTASFNGPGFGAVGKPGGQRADRVVFVVLCCSVSGGICDNTVIDVVRITSKRFAGCGVSRILC